jgi:hypothetical protein
MSEIYNTRLMREGEGGCYNNVHTGPAPDPGSTHLGNVGALNEE